MTKLCLVWRAGYVSKADLMAATAWSHDTLYYSGTHGTTAAPFNCRLILARMRFESKGGRLPRSSGPIVATPPSESVSGKKRARPTWGGGGGGGGGASGRTKKETPAWRATPSSTPPTAPSLFTPSYTPPPRSAGKDRAGVGAIAAAATAAVDARATRKPSEPWTSDSVLRVIKEAGSLGATLEVELYLRESPPFVFGQTNTYFLPRQFNFSAPLAGASALGDVFFSSLFATHIFFNYTACIYVRRIRWL